MAVLVASRPPQPIEDTHVQLTDTELATAYTVPVPAGAHLMFVSAETQAIRYTNDGTTPTSAIGHALAAGKDTLILIDPDVPVKMIRQAAGAIAQVSFYRI